MSPNRTAQIGGHKVEEYYWAGEMAVYVDHQLTHETYEEACDRVSNEDEKPSAADRISALETTTRECLGWIRHWQADVAGNLKPTPDSLAMMEAKLVAILEAKP